MKIRISEANTEPEMVIIRKTEFINLKDKAKRYDNYRRKQQEKGFKSSQTLTKEERIIRARKAAYKRWRKDR